MSETPPPQQEAAFFTTIRGWNLTRGEHGVVGGVVEGLGGRIGMAAVPARLIVVLGWLLFPGIVMLGYAAAWGLLPDKRGNIIIQNFGRGVTNVGALLGIAVLTVFGFGGLDGGPIFNLWRGDWTHAFGVNWGGGEFGRVGDALGVLAFLIPLGLLAGGIVLVVLLVKSSKKSAPPVDPGHTPAPDGPSPEPAEADGDAGADPAHASAAATPAATGGPQPWEPALLPGDPRAGAQPSRGATGRQYAYAAPGYATVPPVPPYLPPVPPAPPVPYYPRVPGPGKGGYLGFLGVMVLSAAIVVGLDRADQLAVSPILAWGACITVGLGAIVVIVALAGRKLGFLGFLSVVAVVLSLLLAGSAQDLRDNYSASWGWDGNIDVEISDGREPAPEPSPVETPVDLSAELASTYGTIYAAGSCTTPVLMEPWEDVSLWGDDTATMRLGAVTADTAIDLDATYTHVAVPAGTSIEIFGSGSTTVIWEDRDISCHDWSQNADYDEFGNTVDTDPTRVLSATNADDPVLTLTGRDGAVIYLEEVAS